MAPGGRSGLRTRRADERGRRRGEGRHPSPPPSGSSPGSGTGAVLHGCRRTRTAVLTCADHAPRQADVHPQWGRDLGGAHRAVEPHPSTGDQMMEDRALQAVPSAEDRMTKQARRVRQRAGIRNVAALWPPPGLQQFSAVYLLALIVLVFGLWIPGTFMTVVTMRIVATSYAAVGVLALGLLIPLVGGEFDISIGSMLAFSVLVVSLLVR